MAWLTRGFPQTRLPKAQIDLLELMGLMIRWLISGSGGIVSGSRAYGDYQRRGEQNGK